MKIDASLAAVDQLLKKTIESESIVNDLYSHVFKVSGKKLRAKLCLISSLKNKPNYEKFNDINVLAPYIIPIIYYILIIELHSYFFISN